MEWVETTGRSVQDAKEAALDELGVDEAEAEFEVLAEAQTGLFGRLRSEARVRARVRPTAPRAKDDRRGRDRRRRGAGTSAPGEVTAEGQGDGRNGGRASPGAGGRAASSGRGTSTPGSASASIGPELDGDGEDERSSEGNGSGGALEAGEADDLQSEGGPESGGSPRPARQRNRKRKRSGDSTGDGSTGEGRAVEGGAGGRRAGEGADTAASGRPAGTGRAARSAGGGSSSEHPWLDDDDYDRRGKGPEVEVDMDRQGEVAADFLTKLTAEMGLDAKIAVTRPDEETVEVQLSGSDLGILIGPKGATLVAVQNLTRTVVFNETGGHNGHINVDVGGYRQKRTQALARFAAEVAEQVKSSGNRTALEPMSAVDRKVVHDTITTIEGVHTISEGEEPRRRVVVLPD
ncbi:MAG: Jag N-terminal domain-containing protein [Actinomycetota bacterium]|nr:Jag N-terminal domain-containing protein [Actinomycetota bacterium]